MSSDLSLPGIEDVLTFPLVEALFGRRSRRFSVGSSIPQGPLAFTSGREPFPLSETEKMVVLAAAAGNTGWHFMITHHPRFAPKLPNYCGAGGGRVFPSAAGFHTTELFFTDDTGLYFLPTRDASSLVPEGEDRCSELTSLLDAHRERIRTLAEGRLHIPPAEPYLSGHNTWCVNRPGSLLVIPVSDTAQHLIAYLCFLVQNGYCIYDDLNQESIAGLDRFRRLVDPSKAYPLSFVEQSVLAECSVELSTSCYGGMLMLQAMGLGGWMFDGVNMQTVLGMGGDPDVPGLGFRYDTNERWAIPNATGLPGVFEGHCPPHYSDMRSAVEAFCRRKFGPGGPYHPATPGPWRDSARVRGSAEVHSEEFRECVALMAQYIYDRFGKFPGTIPTIFVLTYLQAHHLDLEFYDHHFKTGAYLWTHAAHMERWHGKQNA